MQYRFAVPLGTLSTISTMVIAFHCLNIKTINVSCKKQILKIVANQKIQKFSFRFIFNLNFDVFVFHKQKVAYGSN